MVDVSLIVISAIVPFLLLGFNLIVMAVYIDPVAAGGHVVGKFMVLLGMLMAECTVLLLPLDIGNRAGVIGCGSWNPACGGLNLALVWQIAYGIIAGLVVVIMPFFIFYYENDDEGMEVAETTGCLAKCRTAAVQCKRNFCTAFCYTLVLLVIAAITFLLLQFYVGYSMIPYRLYTVSVAATTFAPVAGLAAFGAGGGACASAGVLCACGLSGGCSPSVQTLKISVTYVIYLAALMAFVGWFFFAMYVGIGFIALPMDMINAYIYRPKLLTVSEARNRRKALKLRSEELIKIGEEVAGRMIDAMDGARSKRERNRAGKVAKPELVRFKVLVDLLEKDLEEFQLGDPDNYRAHYNPLVPFAKLVGGVISIVLSLAWLLHIILYLLFNPPIFGFLNIYLGFFDAFFPFFGTLTIALLSMYLLLAAAKGAAKFGTRFFLISVHELEPGKTLLNSFMFNVQLVLICVLPVVQLSTDAFSGYAAYTDAEVIFGSQFKYMEGFRYFFQYNVFYFTIIGFFILGGESSRGCAGGEGERRRGAGARPPPAVAIRPPSQPPHARSSPPPPPSPAHPPPYPHSNLLLVLPVRPATLERGDAEDQDAKREGAARARQEHRAAGRVSRGRDAQG